MINDAIPTVSLTSLSYRYIDCDPDSQVLNSVSLDISLGELVILTGASGSGKTTLLTLIGGLRSGASGGLRVLGKELTSLTGSDLHQFRKEVGFVFQSHNLLPYLTAAENIRMALEVHDHWRAKGLAEINNRCMELLSLLGLEERANFKPSNLSVGQKQRVAIARAIANSPSLILADEPTASLDKDSTRTVITLLKELTLTLQASVLVVTHDNKIIDYADRIIHLDNGQIV